MRKHALSLIALLCIAAPARSQNVNDIVAKYAQKIGGMNRVEAIQSVRRSGKFYGGGGFEAQVKDENKGLVEDAEFDDPLLDYQKKGNKAELVGMDQIDGSDVYKVKLTLASN